MKPTSSDAPRGATASDVPYSAVWTLALPLEREGLSVRVNPPGGGFHRVGGAAPALLVYGPRPRVGELRGLVDVWSPSDGRSLLRRHAAVSRRLGVDYCLLVAAADRGRFRQTMLTLKPRPVVLVYDEDDEGRVVLGNGLLEAFVHGARVVAKNKRASAGATTRARSLRSEK